MLNSNEMVDACNGNTFKYADFEDMLTNYSVYLKGELKDYMLIYMEDSDYSNFISFFDYFQGRDSYHCLKQNCIFNINPLYYMQSITNFY